MIFFGQESWARLARREDAVLLTLDGTLKKEARRAGIRVG